MGKSFYDEGKRLEKDAYRAAKRQEKELNERQRSKNRITLTEAVDMVIPESVAEVGIYQVSVRDLYYIVRRRIQQYTKSELTYSYFSGLVAIYEQENGPIPNLYCDPRGFLYEPHTGVKIELGTREVETYEFPSWLYNKILFVEKKGFVEPFIQTRIPEKYDLCIVASEGYATTAIRTLFQNADRNTDYKLFVMHDADHLGYNISRTMREATKRMPEYHVEVIDIGLKLEEALELGLLTEYYERKNAIPANLIHELTPLELEYFTGESVGAKTWKCKRIELNALGPEERIAFLEAKLAEHGATAKVLPPDDVMNGRHKTKRDQKARKVAKKAIEDYLKIDAIVDKGITSVAFDNPNLDEIKEKLNGNQKQHWSELLDSKAEKQASEAVKKIVWTDLISDALKDKA